MTRFHSSPALRPSSTIMAFSWALLALENPLWRLWQRKESFGSIFVAVLGGDTLANVQRDCAHLQHL